MSSPLSDIHSTSNRTSLTQRLRARIERDGPMTFHDWMQTALYDPVEGYYSRADLIRQGRSGDYRTAPETSPLFAATFARYFAKLYAELDEPQPFSILEAGAGLGDFAFGVLAYWRSRCPQIFAATRYQIDEVSTAARAKIEIRLAGFSDRWEFRRLIELPKSCRAGIVFSNELIDALPVHRVTLRQDKLRELCVGLNTGGFEWVDCDPTPALFEYCRQNGLELSENQIAEVNLAALEFVTRSAKAIARGFVITVDYGDERENLLKAPDRFRGTLRAFRRHRLIEDVLVDPGQQDLTTTIDWTQLKEAGARSGLRMIRHERLDRFLLAEGLLEELQSLAEGQPDSVALALRTSARELIMPNGLAASFQVLVQEKSN